MKFFRFLHQTKSLPISFRLTHSKIMLYPIFGGGSLFLGDHSNRNSFKQPNSSNQRRIISKPPVPMKFIKFRKKCPDIITAHRSVRPSCSKHMLPCRFRFFLLQDQTGCRIPFCIFRHFCIHQLTKRLFTAFPVVHSAEIRQYLF